MIIIIGNNGFKDVYNMNFTYNSFFSPYLDFVSFNSFYSDSEEFNHQSIGLMSLCTLIS